MRITPQIICDIIKDGMLLKEDQIWIYNQRRSIPEDKRLYVVVGLISSKSYGNTHRLDQATNKDDLNQYMQELISINLMSYSTEAIERYHEIMGCMMSTYSQQVQELLAIKIPSIPMTINDVSAIEGATLLNRVAITLLVLRKYSMLLGANYYDQQAPGYIALTEK